MTTFLNVIFVFILAYLGPVMVFKAIYREAIRFPTFFWFSVALTALIFNNNWL